MARLPRLMVPGVPVHIVQRGNNRTATFRSADDFALYRAILLRASQRFGCAIHAYVLMTNHVHLLVTPEDVDGASQMIQSIGTRYVRYANARYNRTGTLWEGRFKSSLVGSERYFLTCSRYIELNPVRAHIVADPRQYRWSSYRCNAEGQSDALITPYVVYEALGSSAADRQSAYKALFRDALDSRTIDDLRQVTRLGGVFGEAQFRERIETTLARPLTRMRHGGDRRSAMFRASTELHSRLSV